MEVGLDAEIGGYENEEWPNDSGVQLGSLEMRAQGSSNFVEHVDGY